MRIREIDGADDQRGAGVPSRGPCANRDPVVAFDDRRAERPAQRHRQQVQRLANRVQGRAGLQGRLRGVDVRGDRRLPRQESAAHRAGVRGRHGDDDGGERSHQAGLPGDGRVRREVRPEELHAGGHQLLHRHLGAHAVDAIQQLHDGLLLQQGRVHARPGSTRPSRPRPGPRWARQRRRSRTRTPCLAATRPRGNRGCSWRSQRLAQRAFATKDNGFGGMDARLVFNNPLLVPPHRHVGRLGQGWPLHLRRAHHAARSQVLQRRVRDDHHLVGSVRQHQAQFQVRVRRSPRCPTTPT